MNKKNWTNQIRFKDIISNPQFQLKRTVQELSCSDIIMCLGFKNKTKQAKRTNQIRLMHVLSIPQFDSIRTIQILSFTYVLVLKTNQIRLNTFSSIPQFQPIKNVQILSSAYDLKISTNQICLNIIFQLWADSYVVQSLCAMSSSLFAPELP